MEQLEKHYTCHACGFTGKSVEAGGLWHCPNPFCTGCGSQWFHVDLKSYKDQKDGYTIDETEKVIAALKYIDNHMTDEDEAQIMALPGTKRLLEKTAHERAETEGEVITP